MTKREPDRTREAILDAGFWEIYRHGFQGASIESILSKAKVTKGALYHHFGSKQNLGYAVVDEVIHGQFQRFWVEPLVVTADPVTAIQGIFQTLERELPPEAWELGCPLNNLAQEMSPLDEGFRTRVRNIYRRCQSTLAGALRQGQSAGRVRDGIDVDAVAAFILASFEGSIGLSKNSQDRGVFHSAIGGLNTYLEALRPTAEIAA